MITSVNGKTDEDQQSVVSFHAQTLKFIPKGIEKFFPKLEVLKIYGSKLESIQQEDLRPFTNLKELHLENNEFDHLSDDLFHFNPELRYLNFNENGKLQFVGENILKPLRKLEQAHFKGCNCISMEANGRLEIEKLKTELKSKCPSPESIKQRFCQDDVLPLKERIVDLERQLAMEKSEKLSILENAISRQKSCNGNLNTATKNLVLITKQLKSCAALKIELICEIHQEKSCEAMHFKVKTKGSLIHEVRNSSENLIQTVKIDKLRIVTQQALYLPINIVELFPSVTELDVIDSGLFEIDSSIFKDMFELKTLNLTRNKLLEIPTETFNSLKNLMQLDLSMNNIENLEPGVFKHLLKVEVLDLNGNQLTAIDFDVLRGLMNLRKLMLQNNKLKVIRTKPSSPLTQLEFVDFSNNLCIDMSYPTVALRVVEETINVNCIAPIELNCVPDVDHQSLLENDKSDHVCRANELTVDLPKTEIFRVNGAKWRQNITTFKAINQSLKFFPYQLAQILPNLEKIVVERSNLTMIQNRNFEGFLRLKSLEIRFNNLATIQEESFDDITQLEHLNLSFNNIRLLPSKIFALLINLKTLILSNNQIQKITADILPRKNVIENFCVDYNQLEVIETKILKLLMKVKLIDFTRNICVDLKFDQCDSSSTTFIALSGEVNLNCSADD